MYKPSDKILSNYAKVLVDFALNSGHGVKPKEVVFIQVPECAKPILAPLRNAVLTAKAYPIVEYIPDGITKEYYEVANDDQLTFFPSKYLKGKVDQADHNIFIIAEPDKHELEGVDPKKLMLRSRSFKPYKDWRFEKELQGKFTWTLALYGTEAMAKEANMSLSTYWDQIIKACFLDEKDPVLVWKSVTKEIERVKNKLNKLEIEKLHIVGNNIDLYIKLDRNHKWLGGSGRNIPSFEIFTSPDWRGTEGHIAFNQPLYLHGNLIDNIFLKFINGEVVDFNAKNGKALLKEMIDTENGNKVGEFSLTDSRFSKITKFMGETLYDENIGGKYGNTHIALGSSYKDAYPGDPRKVSKTQWDKWGYNDSIVHTDIVSTENRTVTAILKDRSEFVIYRDGKFTL